MKARQLVVFVLASSIVCKGGITCNDAAFPSSSCSSRPATYVVSCTDKVGNKSEIQSVLNDAWLGDTIKLEAGCTWSINSPGLVIYRPAHGDSGYLTVTTTEDSKLPAEGTRISPAYNPLLPTLALNTNAHPALAIAGASVSADHIKLRGLRFIPHPSLVQSVSSSNASGHLLIGNPQTNQLVANNSGFIYRDTTITGNYTPGQFTINVANGNWALPGMTVTLSAGTVRPENLVIQSATSNSLTFTTATTTAHNNADPVLRWLEDPSQQPDDVVIQHCVFQNPTGIHKVRRTISLQARSATVRDNFIEGAMDYAAADAQGIGGWNGVGPYTVENNYIQSATENVMFGGAVPGYDRQLESALFRFNYFTHIEERERLGASVWPNVLVFKGRHVFPTGGVSDPNYGWYVATNTGKTGDSEPSFSSWEIPIGGTFQDGEVIWKRTGVSNKPLPKNLFELKSANNVTVQYNVFDGWWDMIAYNSNQQTWLNLKAPNQPGACDWSATPSTYPSCYGSSMVGFKFLNNIARVANGGHITFGGESEGVSKGFGNILIKNNLFLQSAQSTLKLVNILGSKTVISGFSTNNLQPWSIGNYDISNNTFINTTPSTTGAFYGDVKGPMTGKNRIVGNIWPRGSNGLSLSGKSEGLLGQGASNSSLEMMLGCTRPCSDNWGQNIVVGSPTTSATYPPGSVLSNCPTTSACLEKWDYIDPVYGPLFRNVGAGLFDIQPGNGWAKRSLSDGSDIGADMSQLPEIRDLMVSPTDRLVLFRWTVTEPIRDVPCVAEVNTSPDMDGSYVGELSDINSYHNQDADDADRFARDELRRMVIIGHTINLAPETTYYFRLQCGGDSRRGSFTTLQTMTDTADQTITRDIRSESAASMEVEYGTVYSRYTNTINDHATVATACTAGNTCSVSFPAAKGGVVYYRWRELDGSGAVLYSSEVSTLAIY